MVLLVEEEEEEKQCKFCWEVGNNVIAPCACTGTMKFVHPQCLTTWLFQQNENKVCEVCHSLIHFTLPLHQDVQLVLWCVLMYTVFILGVPAFYHLYSYYMSVGG